MTKPIKLVLLYGGKSGEHEISLISAASVLTHLNAEKYAITPIGMDKHGRCFVNSYEDLLQCPNSLPVQTANSKPLDSLMSNGQFAVEADIVFPVVHGPLYEDGALQGLLRLAGAAYVGCDVLASAIGMDKDMTRRLVCSDTIPCARYRVLSWHHTAAERQQLSQQTVQELGWPLFVKPCSSGSSVGIQKANNAVELAQAMDDALRYDETILIEEYIRGSEIELAVLENANPAAKPLVSVPGEIKVNHRDGFYSYTAKYLESEDAELHVPARINAELSERLQSMAVEIFTRIKGKGMARVDFFVDQARNQIYFNEINTIPGFTPISMYPKVWQASGLPYAELLDRLINAALTHQRCHKQLVTDYQ